MSPPTSIILPTIEWAPACQQVANQLEKGDELLIVCDDEADPVTTHSESLPNRARVVFAGEPVDCSGKANAVATGMEEAHNGRIVWTDDDFHHPPDWLANLQADYEQYGPVSELPFFVGRDGLSLLLEPVYSIGGTLGAYAGNEAWGGAVIFEREELDCEPFVRDLRQTVSDDGLLSEYLDITPLKRTRRVKAGGTIRQTLERHVRFTKIIWHHDPLVTAISSVAASVVSLVCLLYPLPALVASTLLIARVYTKFNVRRWTVLLAYPAMLVQVPLLLYTLFRRTFVWGGRRYRWHSKFEVAVLGEKQSS